MRTDRAAVFIDGANVYATAKQLGYSLDYRLLTQFLAEQYDILRMSYYTAIHEDREFTSVRPLVDWLDYNGFAVVTKATKKFTDTSTGMQKYKGNMDIEIAVDMMRLAPYVTDMVLMTGDGDFRSVVEAVQNIGVRVTVYSTTMTTPPMIADELRRQADKFVDLGGEFIRPRLAQTSNRT